MSSAAQTVSRATHSAGHAVDYVLDHDPGATDDPAATRDSSPADAASDGSSKATGKNEPAGSKDSPISRLARWRCQCWQVPVRWVSSSGLSAASLRLRRTRHRDRYRSDSGAVSARAVRGDAHQLLVGAGRSHGASARVRVHHPGNRRGTQSRRGSRRSSESHSSTDSTSTPGRSSSVGCARRRTHHPAPMNAAVAAASQLQLQ